MQQKSVSEWVRALGVDMGKEKAKALTAFPIFDEHDPRPWVRIPANFVSAEVSAQVGFTSRMENEPLAERLARMKAIADELGAHPAPSAFRITACEQMPPGRTMLNNRGKPVLICAVGQVPEGVLFDELVVHPDDFESLKSSGWREP